MRMVFFLLALLGIVGCVTSTVAIESEQPVDGRITLASDLADDFVLTNLCCVRGSSGYLEVQANLVNNREDDCGVEWRVVWLDAAGFEIESAVSQWAKKMVPAQALAQLQAVAPSLDAVDFRFHVRRLRR